LADAPVTPAGRDGEAAASFLYSLLGTFGQPSGEFIMRGAPAWARPALWGVGLLLAVALSAGAAAASSVGSAVVVEGRVVVIGHGERAARELTEGAALHEGDRIRTERGARARLALVDGSTLQLGEETEVFLDWVLHAPAAQSRNVVLELAAGIMRSFVEAVMHQSLVELRTATAITSVRGTEWITEAGAQSTAVVALDGQVAVRSIAPAVPGEVVLGQGEGTDVPAGEPPGPPVVWGEARVADALARTEVPER
jgi:hypothetical protein